VSSSGPLDIPVPIIQIARTLEDAGFEAWCVGGSLRDTLLGYPHSDYDIATSATPEQVQRLFSRTIAVGIKYGTVGVLDQHRELHEVTTFRRDVVTDGRHAVVEYGVSLEEDLARRDFTINAIAYHPLRHEWRDPFEGARDLHAGLVRAVGTPDQRFQEDFLRILRGLRFAARFGFQIEPSTWEAARTAAPGLAQLSAERVRDEWFKGLQTTRSVKRLVSLWIDVGAARVWLPELEVGPLQTGTVPEPPPGARDPILLTALVMKNPSSVLIRLKASNAQIERAAAIELNSAEPPGSDAASVRRWLSLVGAAADDLTDLWKLRQGREPPWADLIGMVRTRQDPLTRSDLAVTGTDLMVLGIRGPDIGRTLTALLDRVLEEPALNTRDALLALARDLS
jgi:tRNA nucleotidyltransferase (CCA-adding enzyme)